MSSTTDLAAALNECMPMTIDGEAYVRRESHFRDPFLVELITEEGDVARADVRTVDSVLLARCRELNYSVHFMPPGMCINANGHCYEQPTCDALAFARAFAAAKRAEGGA